MGLKKLASAHVYGKMRPNFIRPRCPTSGPLPLYQPTFTTEQLQEAQHLAGCYQAPHAQVQRAKMALVLSQEPDISNPALGQQIGVHPNTAFKWRKEWALHGFHLDDAPRTGRPSTFSPRPDCDD